MSFRNRAFVTGALGQGAGLVASLGIQLAQVPLLVTTLGADGYGSYLLVVALPSLLALSDFGLLAAFSTAMLQAASTGAYEESRRLSRLVSGLLAIVGGVLAVALAVGAALLPVIMSPAPEWAPWVFGIYGVYALMGLQMNAIEGVLRAHGDQARAWTAIAAIRVAEFVLAAALLVVTGNIIAFVLGLLAGRALGAVVLQGIAYRRVPWASRRPSLRDARNYSHLWRPMMGSLAQPVSNYIFLQGTTLAVGAALGPAYVAQLGVLRTLAGLIKQGAQVLTLASMPLITRAAALNDAVAVGRQRKALFFSVLPPTIAGGVALTILGPSLVAWWTRQQIEVTGVEAAAFGVEVSIEVVALLIALPLVARNRHGVFGVGALAIAVVYLGTVLLWPSPSLAAIILLQAVAMLMTAGVAFTEGRRQR